ncbi:MAG: aminotransferase class III-fold pyridoxal phosphate-dependent enzyme [Mesorhizobium sp.]|nr:MAG: aminotransferase class III-fold pyridoxal phosphate-dependent enzyme [Mesorhizobium sp.]
MTYQNYSLKQLQQIDAAHHLHPFTDHKELREAGSRIVTHANGPFIYDADGTEILDGMAGLWCVNVGYGRDELAEAAYAQMKELPYYNSFFKCSTPTPVLLSKKLAELAPKHVSQVFYGSSGSEANDTALRLVRHYWALEGKPEKNRIISRKMAYHGSTIAGTSLGGMEPMHKQLGGAVPNIVHVMMPYAYELALPGESDHDFGIRAAKAVEDAILEAGADKVAAFIGEPIMGAGGVVVPPAGYWEKIQAVLSKYDILLVADEVICGFGRTGEMFGSQTFGIKPDIMVLSKQISSSYLPISALLINDKVFEPIADESNRIGTFGHGFTGGGHPVAAAVALENIKLIEERDLVGNARKVGAHLQARLRKLASHPLVGEVRGVGLIAAVELVADKATKAPWGKPAALSALVNGFLQQNGVISRNMGDAIAFCPPLIITETQIDVLVDAFERSLAAALPQIHPQG